MKRRLIISFLCGLSCHLMLQAQTAPENPVAIVDDLRSTGSKSDGEVKITVDPEINRLLGSPWNGTGSSSVTTNYIKMPGYRVQVFSGNDPRHSKDEASSKQKRIKELFPDIPTYVKYHSPRWSLRVGDFRTKEEAMLCLQELKKAFPDFGKEMYPIKEEEVNIPVYPK